MFGSSSPKACGCPISNIPIFHFLPRLDALHTRCTETPLTVTQFRYRGTFLAPIILQLTGYIDPFWAFQRCHWKRGALQLLIWFITQHFKITNSIGRQREGSVVMLLRPKLSATYDFRRWQRCQQDVCDLWVVCHWLQPVWCRRCDDALAKRRIQQTHPGPRLLPASHVHFIPLSFTSTEMFAIPWRVITPRKLGLASASRSTMYSRIRIKTQLVELIRLLILYIKASICMHSRVSSEWGLG